MRITDKKQLTKLISFMTMGDGGVYNYTKTGNAKFIMNMVEKNEDYVMYCKDILENITSCKVTRIIKDATRQTQLRLETASHPFFNTIRDRIYVMTYKSIDLHALKLLDYEALSFLYMSDGCLGRDFRPEIGMINPSYNITLNLKRLSYGDLFLLKKALKDKLDLEFNINKHNQYYYLRLRTKDITKFIEGITPYILPSFLYKVTLG
ncbi:MAG: hypothetical protein PHH29_17030 [Desulfuromonadaceae bacterium]|nr:hypothetical protein [Desulfuromonadaceae bacterium]